MNCLNAPKRNRRATKNQKDPLWKRFRDDGEVSEAVAYYTPDDVEEIDDIETLKRLYLLYTFVDREPSDKDGFYMRTMHVKLLKKLNDLAVRPPYAIAGLQFKFLL